MSEWHRPSVYVVCITLGASMLLGDLGNTGSDVSAPRLFHSCLSRFLSLAVRVQPPPCESNHQNSTQNIALSFFYKHLIALGILLCFVTLPKI